MPVLLKHIEVENFKSYKGRLTIGPLKSFNAIIGPNGSGKSNFMDAVSFVMGEKTSNLRVKKVSDLIHGASINKPVSRSCSVTAVFELEDGSDKSFTRTVNYGSSDHKINSQNVSRQVYLNELEKMGIYIKAKNFLVYQGEVESIAMKNPKELTALFEEISGSGVLKQEYDRLRLEMLKAEEETQFSYQKKKGISAERKGARLEKEEADKYARLKADLADKQIELQLFRLFHNEREIKELEEELKRKQHEVEKIEKKKEKAEEVLKEKKKEQGKAGRELAKIEQEIREFEAETSKKKPQFIKAKERVSHMQKKLEGAQKTLEKARKANDAHLNDIRKLEEELAKIEAEQAEYEATIAGESESQGRSIQLEEAQLQEYHRLKEAAGKQSTKYLQQLDSVNREQKSDQDRLDNVYRMRTDAENKQRQKEHEKEEIKKRVNKLADHIRINEEELEEKRKMCLELQSDVDTSRAHVLEIENQLEDVIEQLGDAKLDKHEDSRRKKKQEILERFKSVYPGVYGRMHSMCQPIHKRYNLAITKVLGKYMEAIVVDTEYTARQCIQYLKEQMLEPETFLPLDYLKTQPLKERLRNIKSPMGVKLVYDVLTFQPQSIRRAVLFAINNALVCETPDDASKVAYEIDSHRYDCVALDGTFYKKSGIISGGSLDLARKAKRWDEKHMAQLKAKKEKLSKELRESMQNSRKEFELNTLNSQIAGYESRLRYSKADLSTNTKEIETVEKELKRLDEELKEFVPSIAEIARLIQVRDKKIKKLKEKINNVEDAVFASFCEQIGVNNIRQYEDRELQTQEQRKQKRLEFEMQINSISSNLEFEKNRDTQNNVSRWERAVHDDEEELKSCRKIEAKCKQEIDKDMKNIEKLKTETVARKQECDQMEEEVGKARREVGTIAKDIQALQKQLTSIETKIEGKKSVRHNILKQCKMDGIAIPMEQGHMENIALETPGTSENSTNNLLSIVSSSISTNSSQQFPRENRIEIDYSHLSLSLRDLADPDNIRTTKKSLVKAVEILQDTVTNIQAPNMKAIQKLEQVSGKLQSTNDELENARKKAKKSKVAFEKVQKERHDKFMTCFEYVANEIDTIYKSLTKNQSAQAMIVPENPEDPFLDGINYNCVAPGKRFQPMQNLSGGEKTVAALALLFGIHSFLPAPYFILDEIDAPLDNTNIAKVASFLREKTANLQIIVISLKEEFFSYADSLFGTVSDQEECLTTSCLSLDFIQFLPN